MDNIAKYPKDWYEAIVRKTKPKKKSTSMQNKDEKTDEESDTNEHLPSINN